MKVTRLMGMAVVLVGLAATISALAYNTATVTNSFSMTVATTGTALEIQPASGVDAGITAMSTASYVSIAVNDKIGLNSTYTYDPVFVVTNNAGAPVKMWMDFGSTLPTGMTVQFCDATAWCMPTADPGSTNFTAGQSRTFKMVVSTGSTTPTGGVSSSLTLHGVK